MNFVGTGRRLAPGDIGIIANEAGIETAVLLAFMEVEANGSGFDQRNRPKILFEPHVLYRNLSGAKRSTAVSQGLAYQKWGTKPYPKSFDERYRQVERAQAIDYEAGLMAASWGIGQILGENAKSIGYGKPSAMVAEFMKGEAEQVRGIVAFLRANGILPMLRGKDFSKKESWVPAVSKYNGSGYAKHNYHGRAATAYVKHKKKEGVIVSDGNVILRRGMRGELVMNFQRDLVALSYSLGDGGADGIFGAATETAVRRFQTDHGLSPVDGIAGPATLARVDEALKSRTVDEDPAPPVWDGQE